MFPPATTQVVPSPVLTSVACPSGIIPPPVLVRTLTGVFRWVVVSSPSCPEVFTPQQYTLLSLARAQMFGVFSGTVSLVSVFPANAPAMLTATGVVRVVVVPSPICPAWFTPQQ